MPGLNPVVVITGATGAIGSATAELLARRNARLLLLGRASNRMNAIVQRLDRDNKVSSVEADLSSLASIRGAARQLSGMVPRGDALVQHRAAFKIESKCETEG